MGPVLWRVVDWAGYEAALMLLRNVQRTAVAVFVDGGRFWADPSRVGRVELKAAPASSAAARAVRHRRAPRSGAPAGFAGAGGGAPGGGVGGGGEVLGKVCVNALWHSLFGVMIDRCDEQPANTTATAAGAAHHR